MVHLWIDTTETYCSLQGSFFYRHLQSIGNKKDLKNTIAEVINIDKSIRLGKNKLGDVSVVKRVRWASDCRTTRPEYMVYSLSVIFGVSIRMDRGEGTTKTFHQLRGRSPKSTRTTKVYLPGNHEVQETSPKHGLLN